MTAAEKLVSVIMPAFNAERFIGRTLESVRAQTYQNWEIIVTNDGSTDGTSQIILDFARKVPQRIEVLHHREPRGPSAARNTAMRAARGDYIAFLDADDLWTPQHLTSLCSVLASGAADLAYAEAFVFRETSSGEMELLPIDTIEVTDPGRDLFRRNYINTSGGVVTRRLMDKVGDFDDTMWAGEERDYWIRAAIEGFSIASNGVKTYYYRKPPGSLSAATAKMAEGTARLFLKHRHCGILPENELVTTARDCFFAAGKLYWRRNPAAASRAFLKSWSLRKTNMVPLLCSVVTSALAWRCKVIGCPETQL